jgi:hypothetical protein
MESTMAEWLARLLVTGVVAWVLWSILKSRYVFEIEIRGGVSRIRKGKVAGAFLASVADACRECGLVRGWIGGVAQGRRVTLRFSRQFSPALRQRLRNEFLAAY